MSIPLAAWKYVDLEHADAVGAGSLRIGTLASYATLENGRADAAEATVLRPMSKVNTVDPAHRAALVESGLIDLREGDPNPYIMFDGIMFQEVMPPRYAFCMARKGCSYTPPGHKPQALFEISDLAVLGSKLVALNRDRLAGGGAANVEYRDISFDFLDMGRPPPDPFVKSKAFEEEQETRFIFEPIDGHRLEAFNTAPHPAIAAHIRRLR